MRRSLMCAIAAGIGGFVVVAGLPSLSMASSPP